MANKSQEWKGGGRCCVCDRYLKVRKGALAPLHVRSVGPLGDEIRCSGSGKPVTGVKWHVTENKPINDYASGIWRL